MDLQQKVESLYKSALTTPLPGFITIAEAELYLQQAYEGRYLFELIQNVRDANKALEQDGAIIIRLEDEVLTIANTGAEFNARGIEAITTIGQSDKQSQDMIGFKGIGFKSVQEISETPRIITRFGSVVFDRAETAKDYHLLDEEDLPLFYCPHFSPETLSPEELQQGIATKIALRLKPDVSEADIVAAFEKIQVKELVLLGHISKLSFHSATRSITYLIDKKPNSPLLTVTKNGEPSYFKIYSPPERIKIPAAAIASLGKKEKKLFANNPTVEIKIVMELNEQKHTKLMENTKLYLFYPLEIISGFRFIMHSYFIVDPERKSLRASAINVFILESIAEYLADHLLKTLTAAKANVTRILTFSRQKDDKLQVLYNEFVKNLKDKKFIYDPKTKNYYTLDQVIIADGFDEELFPGGTLGGKQLVCLEDKATVAWLRKEFDARYLDYADIAKEIETECRRQAKARNTAFFQQLYNYVSIHEGLKLTGKRVLLTDQWKLVTSNEDVFYGGSRKGVSLSAGIKKHIHFIHKDIRIEDIREGRSRTGIIEYNTFELVRRLLKLMRSDGELNGDILNALFAAELDNKSSVAIQEQVLLPVKDKAKWLSPIHHPIYIESAQLAELYPAGNFVDEDVLLAAVSHPLETRAFLQLCGAWNIPAVYVSTKGIYTNSKDEREKPLSRLGNLSTTPFILINDRLLDIPVKFNDWFTNAIFDHWTRYNDFICADYLNRIQFSNSGSYNRTIPRELLVQYSGFLKFLRNNAWISFKGEEELYLPAEVTGIDTNDFYKGHNQVIKRYLKIFPVPFLNKKQLLTQLGMRHLDGDTIENYVGLLNAVYDQYRDKNTDGKDFTDFYNRLLNKLFEFYYFRKAEVVDIKSLEQQWFLALDELNKATVWKRGADIFYIDDRPNYEVLPRAIKQIVQPQFTLSNKQTFGKIAAKIGRKFSDSVTRQLLHTEASLTSALIDYFEELPQSIAILEYMIDKVLDKELDAIKNTVVKERASIRIKVSVEQAESVQIETEYFVDHPNHYEVHIKKDLFTNRNKVIADAVNALFVELLGREPRRYNLELLRFLNSKNPAEYLHELEISEDRVLEIREKLSSSTLNNPQKFWDAVLSAKSVNDREAIFNGPKIDLAHLAALLGADLKFLNSFSANFNFRETSKLENLPWLQQLLDVTELTLKELNTYVYPKLDFRYFFDTELSRLKNKFENGFNFKIHRYLSTKKTGEQQTYLAKLDEYRSQFRVHCPTDALLTDPETYFLELLNETFAYLAITAKELKAAHTSFNLNPVYLKNLKQFKAELKTAKISYPDELLKKFVDTLRWGSLFYFDQVPFLVSNFKSWFATQQPKPEPRPDEPAADIMNELDIQDDELIEDVSTENVPLPEGHSGGGGGSGAHYDGAANDAQKQKIGLAAELIAYQLLAKKYAQVKWVSKNASRAPKDHPGYNPQGDDKDGYDIEYLDAESNKHFVEVKGRGEHNDAFEITRYEVQKAYQAKAFYEIIIITHTLDRERRRIRNLGNLFMLDKGKDFFANDKFTAIYKSFEIRFHQI